MAGDSAGASLAALISSRYEKEGLPKPCLHTKGTYHGYDVALDTQIVQEQIAKRVTFLRKGLHSEE